ncbi:MAG: hypothetical protein ACP5JG_07110 [Anaerolineae bacterium]
MLVETPPVTLDTSRFHAFELTVRSRADAPSRYRYRVWPVGEPDDLFCDLTAYTHLGEAPQGSPSSSRSMRTSRSLVCGPCPLHRCENYQMSGLDSATCHAQALRDDT